MITHAYISKTGDRNVNEDYIGYGEKDEVKLFALADGLGGHGKGDIASKMAVEGSLETFKNNSTSDILSLCFNESQNSIMNEQRRTGIYDEMKTTLSLLLIDNDFVQWGHIGDSRIYLFRNNAFYMRTLDHSVPQMLVVTGEIKEKAIRFHEDRNRLLRVMGLEWTSPKFDLSEKIELMANDSFLMCSDGFWELINEKDMAKLLKKSETAEEWLLAMERTILKNGKGRNMDNYSALAVFSR